MKCSTCGNTILGNYYQFRNNFYCDKCGIRCSNCNQKINQIYSNNNDNKPYCKKCISKLFGISCTNCGKELRKYVIHNGLNYCVDCYQELFGKKCDNCGKNLTKYYIKDKKNYCNKCYKSLFGIECVICGKKLLTYINLNGETYCKRCLNKQKCISCSKPVGEKGIHIGDKLYSCEECYRNALLDDADLYLLYQNIIKSIMNIINHNLPPIDIIKLVTLKELRNVRKWASRNTKGYYTNINGKKAIYVIKGLSKEVATGTIVHELAHYYQDLTGIKCKYEKIHEGFAEWLSYKVLLLHKMDSQINLMINNSYKVYSNGLNLFIEIEKKNGIKGVLNHMKKNSYC
jgi:hypothetical protein